MRIWEGEPRVKSSDSPEAAMVNRAPAAREATQADQGATTSFHFRKKRRWRRDPERRGKRH